MGALQYPLRRRPVGSESFSRFGTRDSGLIYSQLRNRFRSAHRDLITTAPTSSTVLDEGEINLQMGLLFLNEGGINNHLTGSAIHVSDRGFECS